MMAAIFAADHMENPFLLGEDAGARTKMYHEYLF
jgi:hypothetical protein